MRLLRGEQHLVEVGELQRVLAELPLCRSCPSASRAASSSAVGAAQIALLDHVAAGAAFTSSFVRPDFTERGWSSGSQPVTAASSCLCNSSHCLSSPLRRRRGGAGRTGRCSFSPSRLEVEVAGLDRLRSPSRRLGERPRAPVPHDHVAAAVLAARDHALEVEVVERMVLDVHGQALHVGVERRALRHGPAHAARRRLRAGGRSAAGWRGGVARRSAVRPATGRTRWGGRAGRLGRDREVALLAVGREPVLRRHARLTRSSSRACRALPRPLRLVEAGLERGHEVDDVRRRLGGLGLVHDLLACLLRLDALAQLLDVRVVILVRVPVGGQSVDELARHLQRRRVGLGSPRRERLDRAAGHDLVGEAHRRHRQRAVERTDRRQVLLVAHHHRADRDASTILHRGEQQLVRLLRRAHHPEPASRCARSRSGRSRRARRTRRPRSPSSTPAATSAARPCSKVTKWPFESSKPISMSLSLTSRPDVSETLRCRMRAPDFLSTWWKWTS